MRREKMKRIIISLLIVIVLSTGSVFAESDGIKVVVNNEELVFDVEQLL